MADEVAVIGALSVGASGTSAVESAPPTDSGVETSVELETQDSASPEAGASETGTEAAISEPEGDSRLLPKDIRELKETNPALYKQKKAEFFELRNYRSFGKPSEIQQKLELIEEIGGAEGWEEVQGYRQQQDDLNRQYTSPDPEQKRAFVKGLLTEDPGAFRGIVPIALDEFHRSHPQDYARTMSRIIANTFNLAFDNLGVKRVLAQAKQKIAAAGTSVPEIEALEQWVSRFEEIANSHSGMDEDRERFEREKQEWQTTRQKEENAALTSRYQSEVRTDSQRTVKRHLSQLLQGNLPDAESMTDLVEHIEQRIAQMASQDKRYTQDRNRLLSRKDTSRAKKLVLKKINELLPEAAKRELKLYNFGAKPKPKVQAAAAGASAPASVPGVSRVAKQPASSEINWSRSAELVMRGEAILKNGQHVRWE